jgi:class 3 adenylate cyclase
MHREGDLDIAVGGALYMAGVIPGARYVEMSGDDHLVFAGDQDAVLDEIEQFQTGLRPVPVPDTVLATFLCAEVVEAMVLAAGLGEPVWQAKVTSFERLVGEELARFRGQVVRSTTMGFIATFSGPARAIRCARSIVERASEMGLGVRAGLHTGECSITTASTYLVSGRSSGATRTCTTTSGGTWVTTP